MTNHIINKANKLIDSGRSIDTVDHNGNTLLSIASSRNNIDTVKYLVEHGAVVNLKQDRSNTYLHFAASEGHPVIVKYLLECGADPNVINRSGRSPLHSSVLFNTNIEVVKYLLEYGANKHQTNHRGQTADIVALDSGHREIAEYIRLFELDNLVPTKGVYLDG